MERTPQPDSLARSSLDHLPHTRRTEVQSPRCLLQSDLARVLLIRVEGRKLKPVTYRINAHLIPRFVEPGSQPEPIQRDGDLLIRELARHLPNHLGRL